MDLGKRAIIILDRDYFPLLYRFRAQHPETPFRLLTPEDIRSRLGMNFASSPIPYLLKQGLDYEMAKKWMRILSFGVGEDNPRAKGYLDALPKDLLRVDPLGRYELSNADLYCLELQEDVETHALLRRNGFNVNDITLTDLGIEPVTDLHGLQVTLFQNKYEQFDAVFSLLRQRYLEKQAGQEGVEATDVRLFVQDEGDAFYLRLLGDAFGVPIRMEVSSPLYAQEGVSALCDALFARKDLALSEEEKASPAGQLIQGIIDEFDLGALPFDLAYRSAFEILQARKQTHLLSPDGVLASSGATFTPEKEIYLTCLQHGPFHNVYSDDDVLSDAELLALGLNPSYVKTQLERRKKRNYLAYHRFALLSRVKQHLDEKIYPSGFAEEYGFVKVTPPCLGTYSSRSCKNRVMSEVDRAFYSKPIGEYRGYDSSFKGIEDFKFPKPSFAITNLESYRACPYRYYLNLVLPKLRRDYRAGFVGTMIHKALEHIYSDDYDMEQALLEGKAAYLEERRKNDVEPIPFDDILIEATLTSLRRMLPLVEAQKRVCRISEEWSEEWFEFALSDESGTYRFKGAIDNILRFEVGQSHYVVINDYKSGAERFRPYECFLGGSTQLPLYFYALSKGKQCSSHSKEPFLERYPAIFAGMGIKPVAARSLSSMFKNDDGVLTLEEGYKSLASSGAFLMEETFWSSADPNYRTDHNSLRGRFFYAGKATFDVDHQGNLSGIAGSRPYGLEELVDDAVKGTLGIIHEILSAKFQVAPSSGDLKVAPDANHLSCSICSYRDICYRNPLRDAKDYSIDVDEKFKKGGNPHGL